MGVIISSRTYELGFGLREVAICLYGFKSWVNDCLSRFRFYSDSYKFIGLLGCLGLVGFIYSVIVLLHLGVDHLTVSIRAFDLVTTVSLSSSSSSSSFFFFFLMIVILLFYHYSSFSHFN